MDILESLDFIETWHAGGNCSSLKLINLWEPLSPWEGTLVGQILDGDILWPGEGF